MRKDFFNFSETLCIEMISNGVSFLLLRYLVEPNHHENDDLVYLTNSFLTDLSLDIKMSKPIIFKL